LSVEIFGPAIVVLVVLARIWSINRTFEQIQREQDPFRDQEPFGSKRWHWQAVAFLGFIVIVSIWLLRFAEDPR